MTNLYKLSIRKQCTCRSQFGSCTKSLSPRNSQEWNVKFIHPKYMLGNLCATQMMLEDFRMGGNTSSERTQQWQKESHSVWGLSGEVERKRVSRSWSMKKTPNLNAVAYATYAQRCLLIKSTSLFSLNLPLHNQAVCCCTKNLLLWATIKIVLMEAPPENGHLRVQCVQFEASNNIFYSLHATGHTL